MLIDHVIKHEVDWKENKLPVLIEHLKSITDRYNSELEKAVIGRGEWCFTSHYSHLRVPEVTWFSRMSQVSKERHMKQVLSCTVTGHSYENTHSVLSATSSSHSDAENHPPTILDVKVEDCGIMTVSMSVLKNMWQKAEHILRSKGGILKVPWSSDKETRLVMSSSSEQPHLVKKNSRNKKQYCCVLMSLLLHMTMVTCVHFWSTLARASVDRISQRLLTMGCQVVLAGRVELLSAKGLARLSLWRHDQSVNALKRVAFQSLHLPPPFQFLRKRHLALVL